MLRAGADPVNRPNAVVSAEELLATALRTYERDLNRIHIRGPLAETITWRTLAALRRIIDDDGVSLEDRQAACLVGERVLVAVASTMLGIYLAAEDARDDETATSAGGGWSPLKD